MPRGAFFANWLTFEPHSPTKNVALLKIVILKIDKKKHSKLMGPEEIHIFFCEGALRPLKENVIDPKTWKFF